MNQESFVLAGFLIGGAAAYFLFPSKKSLTQSKIPVEKWNKKLNKFFSYQKKIPVEDPNASIPKASIPKAAIPISVGAIAAGIIIGRYGKYYYDKREEKKNMNVYEQIYLPEEEENPLIEEEPIYIRPKSETEIMLEKIKNYKGVDI